MDAALVKVAFVELCAIVLLVLTLSLARRMRAVVAAGRPVTAPMRVQAAAMGAMVVLFVVLVGWSFIG